MAGRLDRGTRRVSMVRLACRLAASASMRNCVVARGPALSLLAFYPCVERVGQRSRTGVFQRSNGWSTHPFRHAHGTAPPAFFRRDPTAMQLWPGQSLHGTSPLTGAKQCSVYFRFAPVPSTNDAHPCMSPFGFPAGAVVRKGSGSQKQRNNGNGNDNAPRWRSPSCRAMRGRDHPGYAPAERSRVRETIRPARSAAGFCARGGARASRASAAAGRRRSRTAPGC